MADQKLEQIVQRMIDAGEPEDNIASVIQAYTPVASQQAPQTSGGATAAVAGVRALPAVGRTVGKLVANHPSAAQKAIGAGISTMAGGIGGAVGGVPGAVVGASIRGVTPAQTTIRQMAGRMAGETPAVASDAAKALGIQHYAKELTGMKVNPSDIIPKPNAANAIESYANSMERGILRLYGPSGEVVSGPSTVSRLPVASTPTMTGRLLRGAGKVLGPLQAATGVTDFAQAVEPTRRDIGVMGIGLNEPRSAEEQAAHPALINAIVDAIRRRMGR
jgi:hypothetical protein